MSADERVQAGLILRLDVSKWSGSAKLEADDLGLTPADVQAAFALGRKRLVDKAANDPIDAVAARAKYLLETLSHRLPDGSRFILAAAAPEVLAKLRALRQQKGMTLAQAARRCHECNEEALGRCPDCHFGFCQEHFPKQQHSPCAERQMRLALTQVCYVCGAQVYPDQWSISKTSHYVDQYTCQGCGRYICDELHTQHKTEEIVITREGLRGHR